METSTARLAVGVVVERRAIDNPWRKWRWRTVEIVPGLAAAEPWRLLREGAMETLHAWLKAAADAPGAARTVARTLAGALVRVEVNSVSVRPAPPRRAPISSL